MGNNAVKIEYGDLYVTGYIGEEEAKLPINKLPELEEADAQHIHGFLRITIGDEKIGCLGFLGENDVCFIDWLGVLSSVIECFSTSPQSRFLYCSGEQGDPAFEFCRDNEMVFISYVSPEIYYGILGEEFFDSRRAHSEKAAHFTCDYKDFDSVVRKFIEQIEKEIRSELGDSGAIWWGLNIHPDGRCSNIRHVNSNRKGFVQI